MNHLHKALTLLLATGLAATLARAQPGAYYPPPMGVPATPDSQRNAVNNVKSQVGWLQNATRTASNYGDGGLSVVWQNFQSLRQAYNGFKATLGPQQAAAGANELAELDAGLDIVQESFDNYQQDVAAGHPPAAAMRNLCQVLRQGADVWLQEFNRDCARLRVGWLVSSIDRHARRA
jgi:hypothetical protein